MTVRLCSALGCCVVALILCGRAGAQALPPDQVPSPLTPWIHWVLQDLPEQGCPFNGGRAQCVWPGRLELALDQSGGEFRQEIVVDRALWVPLPGSAARWPLAVTNAGKAISVLERGGRPSVYLTPGGHRLEGRFAWPSLPERLEIPADTAHVGLRVEGTSIPHPRRDEEGHLWLAAAQQSGGEGERLSLSVHRRIEDGVPLTVRTRLLLRVSGRVREVDLGPVLLTDQQPVSITSALPARLEPDGRLRLQVRAGTHRVEVLARSTASPQSMAPRAADELWPGQETWVWVADEQLRQVELSGAPSIDPSRTELDEDWHGLPTYLVRSGQGLKVETTRRGETLPAPNHIALRRHLWLDLDGRGYTVRDELSTQMHQGFRLDLQTGVLGRASAQGRDLLITQGLEQGTTGVELRSAQQELTAVWRAEQARGDLPAVAWSQDAQSLSTTLHLGPGWSVLSAQGVDSISQSWLTDWDLFGFFFVLLVSLAVSKLLGRPAGLLAFATLVLLQHEDEAPHLVWLLLLACLALLRVLPRGLFRSATRLLFFAGAASFAVIALPFATDQLKQALYPQLADASGRRGSSVEPTWTGDILEEEAPMPAAPSALDAPTPQRSRARAGKQAQAKVGLGSVAQQRGSGRAYKADADWAQDPEAVVQTGPGVPNWHFRSWHLEWSGPVAANHRIQLWLLSPLHNRLLSALRILLLGWLALVLLRRTPWADPPPSRQDKPGPDDSLDTNTSQPQSEATRPAAVPNDKPGHSQPARDEASPRSGNNGRLGGAMRLAATLGLVATGLIPRAAMAQLPDQAMLDKLKERLARPPACRPQCVSLDRMELTVSGQTLEMVLDVHSADLSSVALPGPAKSFMPTDVQLDGRRAAPTALLDGFAHVRLEPGIHRIVASGPLPSVDSITLALSNRPHRARVIADGWEVHGVRQDGRVEDSIQLNRRLDQSDGGAQALRSEALPTWLVLERTIELGPTWLIHSTLRRLSPPGTPIKVGIPLLEGEAITDAAFEVSAGELRASLGRDDTEVGWSSSLAEHPALALTARGDGEYLERWTLRCGPMWHCLTQGLTPVARTNAGRYEPRFAPWPGEALKIVAKRPEAAEGQSVTIDEATLHVQPGVRMLEASLELEIRASKGGTQQVTLPATARVLELTVDGEARPLRQEGKSVSFTLEPGHQRVHLQFQEPRGLDFKVDAPHVDLHRPLSNARLQLQLPSGRWLLWTQGPAWGPAILFWPYLLLALLLAVALGRTRAGHLGTLQWALLVLGLTQIPAVAALVPVGWFFLLKARSQRTQATPLRHNLMQLGLLGYTLAALGCLYAAVHAGLILQPDMQVQGAASSATELRFYVDSAAGRMPNASIVSVSLWAYRILMLAWSLWLAASLVRWLPWAFQCYRAGGLWKRTPKLKPPTPAHPAPTQAGPPAPPGQDG